MTPDEIETANAVFYRDTLQAFTQASLAAWREHEAAERQRRADLMAHWLGDTWNRLETEDE